jgi:thiol:disulfide interchange protein DsbD
MGAAGSVASKHGATGAFSNGVLATLLATPCTAPFLGAALGFAVGQSAGTIAVIFLTAGFGLAFPYVVLSWQPGWLKFLPKPGPWMEKFKIAMGFPMLATAFWLMSLVPVHYGEKSWWLGLFLVLVAFAAWIFGTFVQHGSGRRLPAAILALAVLGFAYAFLLEKKLDWRKTVVEEVWAAWSPEAVAEAQTSGRPVLVDFTAKWCLTCNTIVKPALESDAVRKKIAEVKAVPLIADYTRLPDNITRELHRFDRAGVPLVVVFPGKASGKPIVLPEAITPGMVVEALEKAAQ